MSLPLTNKDFYTGDGNPYKDILKSTDILLESLKKVESNATKAAQALNVGIKNNPKETWHPH